MFGTRRPSTQELKKTTEADEALQAAEKEVEAAVEQRKQARARMAKVGRRLQALGPVSSPSSAVFASHPHTKK